MVRVVTTESCGGSFAVYDADASEWYGKKEPSQELTNQELDSIAIAVVEMEIELL